MRTGGCLGVAFLGAALTVAGCGGSPADITGTYATMLTNGENNCPGTWTVGDESTISVVATQSGSAGTLAVQGVSGAFLQAAVGSSTFNVKVSGDHVTGELLGTVQETLGSCDYTWKAELDATLEGDSLQGTVTYSPQTNGDPDCTSMSVQGCSRQETFSGARAPQS